MTDQAINLPCPPQPFTKKVWGQIVKQNPGKGYRKRLCLTRRARRLLKRLADLPPVERDFIISILLRRWPQIVASRPRR